MQEQLQSEKKLKDNKRRLRQQCEQEWLAVMKEKDMRHGLDIYDKMPDYV